MRQLFLLILLFVATTSLAQKLRFSNRGNHWITGGLTPDCVLHGNAAYDTLDTVISGKQYLRLNAFINAYPNSISSNCGGARINDCLIREDSIKNRVYYRGISDTAERILYDYNLQVGDTINYIREWSTSTDSVINIDSTLINGLWHKVWFMHNTGIGDWRVYSVVEGLGCTNNPLFPAYFFVCFEYYEKLLCFSQDTVYPKINAPYQMCVYTNDSFVNSPGCIILSTQNLKKENPTISITPNPASDYINISADIHPESPLQASILNITGNYIYKSNLKETTTINVANFPSGLYIVTIQNQEGILKREKILITR